ncbi:MAG TPA: UDP-N-acetylmuramoyl-tripeptide--D-alanyl-D-alanine ligase [Halanaerobiales bacterium]|nr:UDP-N-acetylmuramoyl-tripeptide--D-alanyl-D-alanine ligase [Halanaerobiales bacterium]
MLELKLEEIKEAVSGEYLQGDCSGKISGISIDSRTIRNGELFIAIKGEFFDGHDFIEDAIKKGASGIIVHKALPIIKTTPELPVIQVSDTLIALQNLAQYYRLIHKNLKVIAITGSVGKTSTKDITAAILSEGFNVSKTEGNYNNHIGLPLTLLKMDGNEDFIVLEMGMSKIGEISVLTDIARPDLAIITNIGSTHLEFLGSVENVAKGKSELITGLPEDGIAVLNADNRYVSEMHRVFRGKRLIYYGIDSKTAPINKNSGFSVDFFRGRIIKTDYDGSTYIRVFNSGKEVELILNKPGKHNVYNALAAITVARINGLNWTQIQNGLSKVKFSELRWEVKELTNGARIINDTYNANPLSMRAALKAAKDIASGRLIVVFGAMLELGEEKEKAHQELGDFIFQEGIDLLFTVGDTGKLIADGAINSGMKNNTVFIYKENYKAACKLVQTIDDGDTVLIKGSRGNRMEEIAEILIGVEE